MDESTATGMAEVSGQGPVSSDEGTSGYGSEESHGGKQTDAQQGDGSKSSREVARLVNVIKNLQAENSRLKADPADEELGDNESDESLPEEGEDEETEEFSYDDEDIDVSDEVGLDESLPIDYEEALSEIAFAAQMQAAQEELFDAVEAAISDMRGEAFPGLSGEHAELADEYLLSQADAILTRSLSKGEELSPELVERAGREAIGRARQLFGVFGQMQVEDNLQYADTYRVKPDGLPGTRAPIDESKLSRAERNRLSDERARLAVAMRREG